MNEIVENYDGTYSMRSKVNGVEQLRKCEAILPGLYRDGRPNTTGKPVVCRVHAAQQQLAHASVTTTEIYAGRKGRKATPTR